MIRRTFCLLVVTIFALPASAAEPVRVFIFAGQSNMVGSDSKVKDIDRFPPFRGLEKPQPAVRFSYCMRLLVILVVGMSRPTAAHASNDAAIN